jgi:hypothetical protein
MADLPQPGDGIAGQSNDGRWHVFSVNPDLTRMRVDGPFDTEEHALERAEALFPRDDGHDHWVLDQIGRLSCRTT